MTRNKVLPTAAALVVAAGWLVADASCLAEDVAVVFQAVAQPAVVIANIDQDGHDAAVNQALAAAKPLLQVELSFANRVCQFDDNQRAAVVAASRQALQNYAIEEANNGPGNGLPLLQVHGDFIGNNQQEANVDVAGMVATAIAEHGTTKQHQAYEREVGLRRDFRRETAAAGALDLVQQWVRLSKPQRKAIADDLFEAWSPDWDGELAMAANNGNNNFFPAVIPDNCISAHLTAAQRTRWKRVSKVRFGGRRPQLQQLIGARVGVIQDVSLEPAK